MSSDLDRWLEQAISAAQEAGDVIRAHLGRAVEVRYKGPFNPVTQVDMRCQELIRARLIGANPSHAFLGEEDDGHASGQSDWLWVVDPLDGTKNFAHGYPVVAVSIALEVRGRVELAVVHDPARRETFTAVRGQGARLNGEPLTVSSTRGLEESLLMTGFARSSPFQFELFVELERLSQGVRRDGSAALNLCYVAAGRLDGFWEWGLAPWDMAAGSLLVTEAGGTITDLGGRAFDLRGRQVLASNTVLHRPLVEVIAPRLALQA